MTQESEIRVFTIGHSTRSLEAFIGLLAAHNVECLMDVRTVPRSRRNPQFNRESLPSALSAAGVGYVHESALGGLRKTRADSPNTGWRNASFRGYADYMQTPEFAQGVARLVEIAARKRTAIMCAEAVPWRCHRSLIADALVVRGIAVEHILSGERTMPHTLTGFAVVENERIRYPGPDQASGDLFGDSD
ncbi:MAG TPA: DUF488 domain-containing protein [Gammaproteobacteria bacterium]|nr:DUF488 domain-containing protein [Gammaproteobacteria bacterium]